MTDSLKLSVIVPTLNRETILCDTLRYFLERETYRPFELLVVDQTDQHEPATDTFLALHASRLMYFRVPFRSLTKARNFGVGHASGDVIVFVDDDVEPTDGFLAGHAETYRDSSVSGVTGPALAPGQQPRTRDEIAPDEYRGLIAKQHMRFDVGFDFDAQWAVGCNMSFRRSVIEAAGGFDEHFYGVAVGEDSEFSHRVTQRGGRIAYRTRARLIHKNHPSGGCRTAAEEEAKLKVLIDNANYFQWRIGAKPKQRVQAMWRIYRQRVLSADASISSRVGLSRCFIEGLIESERRIRSLG